MAVALLWLAGCAAIQEPLRGSLSAPDAGVAECARWFQALDRQIDASGVRDGGEFRIPGFPYLRTDRVMASFRTSATEGPAQDAWLAQLRALDRAARDAELRNLPEAAIRALGIDRQDVARRTEFCARTLLSHDRNQPGTATRLAERAKVPDDYRTWQRALGLYGLVSVPFSAGVEGWQRDAVEAFRASAAGNLAFERSFEYRPQTAMIREDPETIFARSQVDALGIRTFSPQDADLLFEAYAPIIEMEAGGSFDEIGRIAWQDGALPGVQTTMPTVYRKLAHTRYGADTLVQLVYMAWFPERPHRNVFDLLAGKLDGMIWRVTLNRRGAPLLYDTIHPCGCFHMFFPVEGVELRAAPSKWVEWAFVPAPAPRLAQGERIRVRLQSRTHYMVGISADGGNGGREYEFADYDTLRALPHANGSRSLFRPDGLIAGTERAERVFFWPMGVPSAGAMRQWGHHATAFLGRRHFDDAELISQRFLIDLN